ncbi:MAG: hypothetical protein RIE22_02050 [Alphaproteobacteria bacterium]
MRRTALRRAIDHPFWRHARVLATAAAIGLVIYALLYGLHFILAWLFATIG